MSVKLSELLEAGAASLSIAAEESWSTDLVQQFTDEAKSLRAIAPALVEFVAADHAVDAIEDDDDFETAGNMDALQAVNQRLINASRALRAAMKEAGVTCE